MDEIDAEERARLDRWEKTSAKMTEDMKDDIHVLVHDLERCLKFGDGRIWLDLRAHTMLAHRIYGVSWFDSPDLSKGRREAVEHTRRKLEARG